jgi:2-polyprenyl-3-methyl-5-hydroxy-6-metoxy-1,4-benzoquinol methylase
VSDPDGSSRQRRGRLAPPSIDQALIERLNTWWRVGGPELSAATWKQRVAYPLRRALALVLGPQETFNSALVQYVNAANSSQSEAVRQIDEALDHVDDMRRYQEALGARERRMEAAMRAIRAEHDELRTTISLLQQQMRSERPARPEAAPGAAGPPAVASAAPDVNRSATETLSSKYVGFEDQFRGSADAIRERLAGYAPLFDGASDVLDVGCGRGEFLRLLGEHGVRARGIDLNGAMVDVCRAQGLDATTADALGYLRAQPDASLGGLFAAQVVEHLQPAYLTQFLDAAFDKLRPGAVIVLETINPACWFAFFESYIRDITHVRPLHPDTLKFLLVATGFQQIDIRYSAPYPQHEKLQPIAAAPGLTDAAETLNANADKINRLLFTYLDYAAIGRRP